MNLSKKIVEAQKICLAELIALHGGPAAFGREIGEADYNISNWKQEGIVPLHRVGQVARAFKVSTYLLNYFGVADLNGCAPKWIEIVKQVGFSKMSLEKILKAKEPKYLHK